MSGARGSIKGVVLRSRLAYVRENMGEAAVIRVLARLGSAECSDLQRVLPASWYPFEVQEWLDDSIAVEMGIGEKLFRLLGEQSARDNLATSHRAFVDARDPHGLLQHAAAIHDAYYGTGRRTYERPERGPAHVRLPELLARGVPRQPGLAPGGDRGVRRAAPARDRPALPRSGRCPLRVPV